MLGARGCRRTHFRRSNPAIFFSLRRFYCAPPNCDLLTSFVPRAVLKKVLNLVAQLQMARTYSECHWQRFLPNYQRRWTPALYHCYFIVFLRRAIIYNAAIKSQCRGAAAVCSWIMYINFNFRPPRKNATRSKLFAHWNAEHVDKWYYSKLMRGHGMTHAHALRPDMRAARARKALAKKCVSLIRSSDYRIDFLLGAKRQNLARARKMRQRSPLGWMYLHSLGYPWSIFTLFLCLAKKSKSFVRTACGSETFIFAIHWAIIGSLLH